jgi:hypothetical protein
VMNFFTVSNTELCMLKSVSCLTERQIILQNFGPFSSFLLSEDILDIFVSSAGCKMSLML